MDGELYCLVKDGVFANLLIAPVVSVHFPPDQIIAGDKIAVLVKV